MNTWTRRGIKYGFYFCVAVTVAAVVAIVAAVMHDGNTKTTTREVPKVSLTSFDGVWKSAPTSSGGHMTATIKDEQITIIWTLDRTTEGLYWQGTFVGNPEASQIESIGDTELMKTRLLASQETNKIFNYSDGKLSFAFKALGVTKVIELEKQ